MMNERTSLHTYYADLHVHIGSTESGQAVKISGSKNLTFYNIANEASERKGIEIIGVIDCHSPVVQSEIQTYIERGEMTELPGGGIRYRQSTVMLGTEMELKNDHQGVFHLLAFFPTLDEMTSFTRWMATRMKNVNLSSQRLYAPSQEVQQEVISREGILIPAHIFTPHKSIYGNAVSKMEQALDLSLITAVELGLSADTMMASYLSELDRFSFLTNSDAHSLSKIGREYNVLKLKEPSFREWVFAMKQQAGRHIHANYGLDPKLGKYHRTFCKSCGSLHLSKDTAHSCPECGSSKAVRGVMDRIFELADRKEAYVQKGKPPYYYQVPLEFIPGLGPKRLDTLLDLFGTEMNIIHKVKESALAEAVGADIARYIIQARTGTLSFISGGGGKYGKVLKKT